MPAKTNTAQLDTALLDTAQTNPAQTNPAQINSAEQTANAPPSDGRRASRRARKSRPTRAELLRRDLEAEIFEGRLKPGDRLDEISLAKRFGVSRTPVREALRQLSSSGLVEIRPRHGAVVTVITVERLVEMFEVMAELEAMCARLAAERMDEDEHRHLRQALVACAGEQKRRDNDTYYAANNVFHDAIYAGSHNHHLEGMVKTLRNQTAPYRRYQLYAQKNRIDSSMDEHQQVVDAIVAGDAITAQRLMRDHVTVQGDLFAQFLSTLPSLAAS